MNSRQPSFDRFTEQFDPSDDKQGSASERSMGELIAEACKLSPEQVELIVRHQNQHGIRFGEAAIALGFASSDDVLRALSRQFDYDYALPFTDNEAQRELVVASSPFCDAAEGFRELRSQLMMGALSNRDVPRAIAILSPDVGDGKTYVSANLAVAFSQLGDRTLLIDADMRTPRQHKLFGLEGNNWSGLSTVLSGRADGNAVRRIEGLPNLYVMPVGALPPNPLELLQHPAFGLLMPELLSKFDHVIVDTPAAVRGADARVIAAHAGVSVLVGRQGRSRVSAMHSLLKHLAKSPGIIAGVVMNGH